MVNKWRSRRLRDGGWKFRWFRIFLLMAAACLFLGSCENNLKDLPGGRRNVVVPEEGVQIVSYLSENGKVKGKLTAPYMLRYNQADTPYTEFPRSLHVDFYNDSLIIESTVDAKYGKYLPNQEKVFLRDSVVVKNILKGDTLHCEELWWDQHTQRFYTDKPVRIYTKTQTLYGQGMVADQNFRWYNITKMTGSVLTKSNGEMK
jgi:LPS export ABC transporter protein LptC